jgi:hypothetical protein
MPQYGEMIRERLNNRDAVEPGDDRYKDDQGSHTIKERKILSFARTIIYEFANQTEMKPAILKNTDRFSGRECTVRFELYTPNWLGFRKKGASTLTITIGYTHTSKYGVSTCPLAVNGSDYGKSMDIKEIDEDWFISVLVKEYRKMQQGDSRWRWR